jgi:ATP-dependent DNA helicase RecQ
MFIDNNRDNEELDWATRELVRDRDRERLKKMTFYCFTTGCLRDYILRYFGEYGENYCGNCSNCQTQFEEVDVTETAKDILGCVESSRQRYGTTVIIDTIHGANTAKIRNYHMEENPYYGTQAKTPVYRLRQVLNHLQVEEYLTVSNDTYAVVKLTGRAAEVLHEGAAVLMKLAKEPETAQKDTAGKKKRRGAAVSAAGDFTEQEENLFTRLRNLRLEIAREEKVPPYIVFSDKTLVSMCMLKPTDRASMLEVSGVGEFKYEKYGERFLNCIGETLKTEGSQKDTKS